MTGDMPIAHPSTASLLALLNSALENDADEMEILRRAHKVAWHLGIVKASIACKCYVSTLFIPTFRMRPPVCPHRAMMHHDSPERFAPR